MSIVLPARMFKAAFAKRGFAPIVLSRPVGGAATPTSALIPWNSCGAYMAATLGVATVSYAPYAVFNFASPLLVIAIAVLGVRTLRIAPATTNALRNLSCGAIEPQAGPRMAVEGTGRAHQDGRLIDGTCRAYCSGSAC